MIVFVTVKFIMDLMCVINIFLSAISMFDTCIMVLIMLLVTTHDNPIQVTTPSLKPEVVGACGWYLMDIYDQATTGQNMDRAAAL